MIEVIPISLGFVQAFLLRGPKSILIDTGMPGSAPRILKIVRSLGMSPSEIRLILLTHGHADHCGSAWELKAATGAKVAIGALDAQVLRTGINLPLSPLGLPGRILKRFIPKKIRHFHPFEPDILLEGERSLEEWDLPGLILPTPGHTPGSVSVWLEQGDLFVGDLIAGGTLRRNRPVYPNFGESLPRIKESLAQVMRRNPQLIFPSHGGPFTAEAVRRALDFEA